MRRARWRLRTGALILVVVAFALPALSKLLLPPPQPLAFERPVPFDAAQARETSPREARFEATRIPVERSLERGQTLGGALAALGIEGAEARGVVEALSEHLEVRRMRAGEPYLAYYNRENDGLEALEWPVGEKGRVLAERAGSRWQVSFAPYQRRVERRAVSGTLEGSLIGSIERAGAPEMLAYKMAWVLQWDLDFNRDLRLGDRFQVLFEEIYLDGQNAGLGEILTLTYENAGKTLQAFRFRDEDAYYDAEGRPLKKMFLRSPLRFSRITSNFSHRRFHPVLKTYRPHYGVDYGAPVGTPIHATANGVVSFAGTSGGAGRMVKIRHPNSYLTAYLHLSRFARGIRSGRRVSQGEVIGYVGSTGLSTGPHLDYRVQHRGRWINPLSLKSVPAEPIPDAELAEFRVWRNALLSRLELGTPLPRDLLERALHSKPSAPTAPALGTAVAR